MTSPAVSSLTARTQRASSLAFAAALATTFGAAVLPVQSASATSASIAGASSVEYFKVPYGPDIYRVTNRGQASASAVQLSYSQWVAAGSPRPQTMSGTQFVKYAWQNDIYAVTFFGLGRASWVWDKMTLAQWQSMKSPAPRQAGWIYGSRYITYPTDPNSVFVILNGVTHKLTYNEWVAAGQPAPVSQTNQGFLKLSWQGNIAKTSNLVVPAYLSTMLTFSQWQAAGYPQPRQATSFPGDVLYKSCNGNDLIYVGPTFEGRITFAQWQATGMRAPISCQQARQSAVNEAANFAVANGLRVGISVYDAAGNVQVGFNQDQLFAANSTVKAFYVAALLKNIQDAGRAPNGTEIDLINRAIRQSDNNAAASIYSRLGGQSGAEAYARYLGLYGANFYPTWGRTDFSARNGLTTIDRIMYGGSGLNSSNLSLLKSAMQNVISSQHWGTPPTSATVRLKNGWDSTDGYDMGTIHNVQGVGRNYSAAIYTNNPNGFNYPVITFMSRIIYRTML